jgi:hypothetical protein
MSVWMRHRHHGWAATAEMGGAMGAPYVLLLLPLWAGWLSASAFLGAMHVLMLPSMVVAMLRRRGTRVVTGGSFVGVPAGEERTRMLMIHFYTVKPDEDCVRTIAPEHAAYWRDLGVGGYLGRPFDDLSDGLIMFRADSREAAGRKIPADPFVREALLETSVVKQWLID